MKKLTEASSSMVVNITPLASCSFCLENNKPCIAPYIPANAINYNGNMQTMYTVAYICLDCCKGGINLLKPLRPIPNQV